jgi:NHL repeat
MKGDRFFDRNPILGLSVLILCLFLLDPVYAQKIETVDGSGNLYILDSRNHRIQKFSPDGQYSATFGRRYKNLLFDWAGRASIFVTIFPFGHPQ